MSSNEAVPSHALQPSFPQDTASSESGQISPKEEGQEDMKQMEIQIGGITYAVSLYENDTAQAFTQLLPLQIDMQELNGNEKYAYLSQSLPANAQNVSAIHAGDLMLFGDDCIVLFYEDLSTSYRYTRIGYIQNPEGLAEALGTGTAKITFQSSANS